MRSRPRRSLRRGLSLLGMFAALMLFNTGCPSGGLGGSCGGGAPCSGFGSCGGGGLGTPCSSGGS